MTQEEKAKRYDEAIERAKAYQGLRSEMEIIFPELAESEDERIRKALLEHFITFNQEDNYLDDIPFSHVVAWLEKQSESYTKRDVDDAYLKGVTNTKDEIEKQYEATYQIRKDIATFIFNYRGDIKDRAKWMDYLGIKVSFAEKQGEQKPVFEMKTPEESLGVDSDTYNKIVDECIYGEQKPTDKSKIKPKFKTGDRVVGVVSGMPYFITKVCDDHYDTESGCIIMFCTQDNFELYEQKPAWSEEDNEMSRFIGNAITATDSAEYLKSKHIGIIDAHIWLENLKNRVQPQPKQEWSKEDESMLYGVIETEQYMLDVVNGIKKFDVGNGDIRKACAEERNWLEFLKDRYTWKPSEEQMKALKEACDEHWEPDGLDPLYTLYQDLNKLKG